MDYGGHARNGVVEARSGGEIDPEVSDGSQVLGRTFSGGGGHNGVTTEGQLADQSASEGSSGTGDEYSVQDRS
jgi:hypothetical protein